MDTSSIPQPETRTGAQLLRDGVTLSAHHTSAIKNENDGLVRFKWDQFDVRTNDASAAMVFVVNGKTYTLELDDDDGFVVNNRSVNYTQENMNGDWVANSKLYFIHPERNEHMIPVHFQSDDPHWRGYAIAGNQFPDPTRLTGATITYDGEAVVDLSRDGATSIWNRDYVRLKSQNARLVANFDDGTISGQFTNWERKDIDDDIDITFTLPTTRITADGFTGKFNVSGTDVNGKFDVSYEGSFMGPEAQNVAGVMSGTYHRFEEIMPRHMIGYFMAEEPDE